MRAPGIPGRRAIPMSGLAWSVAALMLGLGGAAILAVPDRLIRRPALPLGRLLEAARQPGVIRPDMRLIEPTSPIVGTDGLLIENLGIEEPSGIMKTVIARGTKEPATGFLILGTARSDQTEIGVHLVRGASPKAGEGHSLGWYGVGPLPAGPAGSIPVTLVFHVADGAITLGALDSRSRTPLPLGPIQPPVGR